MIARKNRIVLSDVLMILLCGIWLFSLLFLRKWHILGPVSIRNFAGVIIVPIALFMHGRIRLSKAIITYLIWNFFYVLINLANGFNVLITNDYLAYNVVSFCVIFAIPKLVKTHKTLSIITFWFILFFVLNALVSIFQFQNNSIAWAISSFICPLSENEMLQYSYYEDSANFLFQSLCSGLNGFVVTNGYFIAGFLPIAAILIWKKNKMSIAFGVGVLLLGVASAFCTQQRMCFLLAALYILYIVYFRASVSFKAALFIFGFLIIAQYAGSYLFESSTYGRLLSSDANGRSQTLEFTSMYFNNLKYFLAGNMSGDPNTEGMLQTMGHNCFLDALRRGGIISLFIYIVLFVVVSVELQNVIILSKKQEYHITLCYALAALFNLLYSFTHSENIVNGSVFFWLSYSLMRVSLRIEANKLPKITKI